MKKLQDLFPNMDKVDFVMVFTFGMVFILFGVFADSVYICSKRTRLICWTWQLITSKSCRKK